MTNRKTYAIDPERAKELSQHTLNVANDLDTVVHKQDVLDALIALLDDSAVLAKVKRHIKNNKK